jgi:hypothetical protein
MARSLVACLVWPRRRWRTEVRRYKNRNATDGALKCAATKTAMPPMAH